VSYARPPSSGRPPASVVLSTNARRIRDRRDNSVERWWGRAAAVRCPTDSDRLAIHDDTRADFWRPVPNGKPKETCMPSMRAGCLERRREKPCPQNGSSFVRLSGTVGRRCRPSSSWIDGRFVGISHLGVGSRKNTFTDTVRIDLGELGTI